MAPTSRERTVRSPEDGARFGAWNWPQKWARIFRTHLSPRSRTKSAPPSGEPHCLVSARAPWYRVRGVSAVCGFFVPAQLRRPARTVHPAHPVQARCCSRVTLAPVLRAVVGGRVGCACVWPQQSASRRASGWFVQARRRNARRGKHTRQAAQALQWVVARCAVTGHRQGACWPATQRHRHGATRAAVGRTAMVGRAPQIVFLAARRNPGKASSPRGAGCA